jgi:hypothetical protein
MRGFRVNTPPKAAASGDALVQTLARLKSIDAQQITMRRFMREVACQGGFLARKSDGEPGWRTLWRGWNKLSLIHQGYHLATNPNQTYG